MKVEINNKKESAFKPIELVISIETEQEFNVWRRIFGMNMTIPENIGDGFELISEKMIMEVYEKLCNYKK